jgi:hypothetical protein
MANVGVAGSDLNWQVGPSKRGIADEYFVVLKGLCCMCVRNSCVVMFTTRIECQETQSSPFESGVREK